MSPERGLVSHWAPLPSLHGFCAVLAPLQVQWEQVWRLSKQCHCQGPCFDTSSPTGLKR